MNYDLKMEEQINNMEGKVKTLLLHACCAPCSSACLERLGNNFKISIFYYNPNITNKSEYDKTARKLVEMFVENFKNYDHFPQAIIDAGPGVPSYKVKKNKL